MPGASTLILSQTKMESDKSLGQNLAWYIEISVYLKMLQMKLEREDSLHRQKFRGCEGGIPVCFWSRKKELWRTTVDEGRVLCRRQDEILYLHLHKYSALKCQSSVWCQNLIVSILILVLSASTFSSNRSRKVSWMKIENFWIEILWKVPIEVWRRHRWKPCHG